MGKRELIALLDLSSWCVVVVGRLFLAVPRGCLRFVIVVQYNKIQILFIQSEIQSSITLAMNSYLPTYKLRQVYCRTLETHQLHIHRLFHMVDLRMFSLSLFIRLHNVP